MYNDEWHPNPRQLGLDAKNDQNISRQYKRVGLEKDELYYSVIVRQIPCPSVDEWKLFTKQLGCGSFGCVFTHDQVPATLQRLQQIYQLNLAPGERLVLKLMLFKELYGSNAVRREIKYAYQAGQLGVGPRVYAHTVDDPLTMCPVTMIIDKLGNPISAPEQVRKSIGAYVMQYVNGKTIHQSYNSRTKELDLVQFDSLLLPQLIQHFAVIHRDMNIIHGDVRWHLNNLMFDAAYTKVFVIDWGFARDAAAVQRRYKELNPFNLMVTAWRTVAFALQMHLADPNKYTLSIVLDEMNDAARIERAPELLYSDLVLEQHFEVLQLLFLLKSQGIIGNAALYNSFQLYRNLMKPTQPSTPATPATPSVFTPSVTQMQTPLPPPPQNSLFPSVATLIIPRTPTQLFANEQLSQSSQQLLVQEEEERMQTPTPLKDIDN